MSFRQPRRSEYENRSTLSSNESRNVRSSSYRATPTGPRSDASVQFRMPTVDASELTTRAMRLDSHGPIDEASLRRHISEIRDKETLKGLKQQIMEQLVAIEMHAVATNPTFSRNQQSWTTMRETARVAETRTRGPSRRFPVSNHRGNNSNHQGNNSNHQGNNSNRRGNNSNRRGNNSTTSNRRYRNRDTRNYSRSHHARLSRAIWACTQPPSRRSMRLSARHQGSETSQSERV